MEQWGRQLIRRSVDSLAQYRRLWLAFVILIPILCFPIARQLSFDQNIQSLFSVNDERLLEFAYAKERFGGDEFAIVAWKQPDLFKPRESEDDRIELTEEAVNEIVSFADELSEIPGVNAGSTQHLAEALRFRFGREAVVKLVENVLISEDRTTTAVVLRLQPLKAELSDARVAELAAAKREASEANDAQEPDGSDEDDDSEEDDDPEIVGPPELAIQPTVIPRGQTIAAIRRAAREHNPPAYVVGEPIQVDDMFRIVQRDGAKLFVVSLLILSAVLFFLFRNLRWVILPIIAVVSTIICTEALLVVSQIRLSMVSSMLNSMVTIIVIATSTHVTVHYRELRRKLVPEDAMKQTLRDLAAPVFWTCATTAVGFMALLSSQITPVSSFGLMMGLAAMVAFAIFALLFPGGILVGKRKQAPLEEARTEELLSRILARISGAIESRPLLLWLSGLLLMALTVPGLFRLRMETDFSKNFSESSDIVQSLQFVEHELGGAGTWEVNFPAPSLDDIDDQFLDRVRSFANRLKEIKGTDGKPAIKVGSLTDGTDMLPRLRFGVFKTMPGRLKILEKLQAEFVPSLYDAKSGRMRIVLRSREQQRSEEKLALIQRVDELAKAEFSDASDDRPPSTTGMFVLLTFVIQSLLGDQLISFALAAIGISLMMMFAFRSVSLGLLSLIPNVFPIVLVIGTMGWTGTPVNIGTAMIASVSMGLTVDSTIHYISAFRREAEHNGLDAAVSATHQTVGRALVFAHIALIAGFLVLTLSDFVPLVYFGVLLSLSMVGGLIGDLVMLPILLRWHYGRKSSNLRS